VHTSVRPVGIVDEAGTVAARPPETVAPEPMRRPGLSGRTAPSWAIALGGLAIAVTLLTAITLDRRLSTDVFWQLAAGQWMLAHHGVMGLDPFSYTESHRKWVADEWGSEVIFASLYKVFGAAAYNLIAIFTGTLCLIGTMLYQRALGARGGRLAVTAVLVTIGIAGFVTQDRGLSFSLIWLPLELLILTKARTNPRWLWWLPPLCLLWVNTHGSILIGLFVLGVELAWSLAPGRWAARIGGVGRSPFPRLIALATLGGVAASCVSPYGPHLLVYDLGVSTNTQIGNYIEEWMSPDFHSVMALITYCLPLAIFIFAVRRRRIMLLEATLTAAFFLGALHSDRIVIYLFIAVAGLAASLPKRREWVPRTRRMVTAVSLGFLIGIVAYPSVPAGTVTTDTPVQAFNFLAAHPGRIFTQYAWGDYSIARHRATFVDGRTDLFTGKVLSEFFAVSGVTTDPDQTFDHYGVDYVVWARNSPLAEYLAHDSRWEIVDRTAPALVFARRSAWSSPTR
jgi:hypothetical protein